MTKEEFKTKKDIINSKIEELNNEMEKLKKEYIESNVKYPIGSKVCIITPAHKEVCLFSNKEMLVAESRDCGYVMNYEINYRNDIELCLKKVKKDGTISKTSLYVNFKKVKIELVKE